MADDQTNRWLGDALVTLRGDEPAHVALERELRDAVREGRLRPGAVLPPSRALARDLGVSRWVVTQAYGGLVAEGVLDARTGAGTRVALGSWTSPARTAVADRPVQPRAVFDLGPGVPDLRHLPRAAWVAAVRTAVASASPGDLVAPDPRGVPALRRALADRLAVTRAVVVGADEIVVTHGAADGMTRLARSLRAAGHDAVLVEDPSWPRLRDAAAAAGLRPVPVPVDEDGVDTGALVEAAGRTGARVALVTPAHQFPVGAALAPARREALVRWARAVDGVIVEDDYDAEFRYDRRPVAALRALAPDRVALLGSLSKTLAAGFGVGWLVPPDGVPAARAGLDVDASAPPSLHQLACAALLAEGAYDRHLRAARTRYRRRRAALLDALDRHLPALPVSGLAAGLHVVVGMPAGVDEDRVVRLAARRDVRVIPAGRYRIDAAAAGPALILGYGNLVDARLDEAVSRLAAVIGEASQRGESDGLVAERASLCWPTVVRVSTPSEPRPVEITGTDGGLRSSLPPEQYELVRRWVLDNVSELRGVREGLREEINRRSETRADELLDGIASNLVLVASELATNAIRHGRPPTIVELLQDDTRFLLAVSDHDLGSEPRIAGDRPPGDGGFGLQIARRLSFDVGWYQTDEVKVVWAELGA